MAERVIRIVAAPIARPRVTAGKQDEPKVAEGILREVDVRARVRHPAQVDGEQDDDERAEPEARQRQAEQAADLRREIDARAGRSADRMPSGMPNASATSVAALAAPSVTGSRCASSASTGRPVRIEYPASPRASELSSSTAAAAAGRSRSTLAGCPAARGVSTVEVPSRAAIASPGMSRTKRNASSETPSSVGIVPMIRFAQVAAHVPRRRSHPTGARTICPARSAAGR